MSGKSLEGQPFGPPRRQLPFTGETREAAHSYASPVGSKGERSEPRVRAFGLAVERRDGAEVANKPNGTPARRKAGWCEEGGGTAKL